MTAPLPTLRAKAERRGLAVPVHPHVVDSLQSPTTREIRAHAIAAARVGNHERARVLQEFILRRLGRAQAEARRPGAGS